MIGTGRLEFEPKEPVIITDKQVRRLLRGAAPSTAMLTLGGSAALADSQESG
jgi:hypothetical protein